MRNIERLPVFRNRQTSRRIKNPLIRLSPTSPLPSSWSRREKFGTRRRPRRPDRQTLGSLGKYRLQSFPLSGSSTSVRSSNPLSSVGLTMPKNGEISKSRGAFQKPSAPSPTAISGAIFSPRFLPRRAVRASSARSRASHLEADKFFLAFRRPADQHQHAFAVVFHARLQKDAVRPHVHVPARRRRPQNKTPPKIDGVVNGLRPHLRGPLVAANWLLSCSQNI